MAEIAQYTFFFLNRSNLFNKYFLQYWLIWQGDTSCFNRDILKSQWLPIIDSCSQKVWCVCPWLATVAVVRRLCLAPRSHSGTQADRGTAILHTWTTGYLGVNIQLAYGWGRGGDGLGEDPVSHRWEWNTVGGKGRSFAEECISQRARGGMESLY